MLPSRSSQDLAACDVTETNSLEGLGNKSTRADFAVNIIGFHFIMCKNVKSVLKILVCEIFMGKTTLGKCTTVQ